MRPQHIDLWERALDSLKVAKEIAAMSPPDISASRSYYAAFYAVSAYFALQGKAFRKHSGVEAALHRELVKPGVLDATVGEIYSRIVMIKEIVGYQVYSC